MATLRTQFHRVELHEIALLVAGMIVGALLVAGITALQPATRSASVPQVVAALPTERFDATGGRLGGIASSDTATDWRERQSLSSGAVAGSTFSGLGLDGEGADILMSAPASQSGGTLVPPRLDEETFYRRTSGNVAPAVDRTHALDPH